MSITIYKIPKTKSCHAIFERSMLLLLVLVFAYGIANAENNNIRVTNADERGLEVATGVNSSGYQTMFDENADAGQRMHLASKASVSTVMTFIAASKIITELPDIAKKISSRMISAKSLLKFENLADVPKHILDAFKSKLNTLADKGRQFLEDFTDATDDTRRVFINDFGLIDAWKALHKSGLDSEIRTNTDYLQNLSDFSKRTGSGLDDIIEDLKKFEDGPEPFLDELGRVARTGYWEKNPFQRGRDIEDALGQNLPETFKTIDKYHDETGEAVSIKSLDLDAKTYQTPSKLRARLNKYLTELNDFTEYTQGIRTVGDDLNPVNSKTLELAIPRAAAGSQLDVINEITSTWKSKINIKVIVMP